MTYQPNALKIGFAAGFVIGLLTIGKKPRVTSERDPSQLVDDAMKRMAARWAKSQTQLNRAMKEQYKLEHAIQQNEKMLAILIERQQYALNSGEDPGIFQTEIDKHKHILAETKTTHRDALKTVEDAHKSERNEEAHYRHKRAQALMLKAQWSFLQARSAFANNILMDVQDGTDEAFERVQAKLEQAQTIADLQNLARQIEVSISKMETMADTLQQSELNDESNALMAEAMQLKQKSLFLNKSQF